MLAESIAASSAEMASHGEVQWLAPALRLLVKRNDEILSAALRTNYGELAVEVGSHAGKWTLTARIRRPTGRSRCPFSPATRPGGNSNCASAPSSAVAWP